VSSNVYRSNDSPWYPIGHGIVLTYIGIGWISTLILRFVLKAENDRRDRGERDEIIGESGEKGYESIDAVRQEKGDQWSGFRYIY